MSSEKILNIQRLITEEKKKQADLEGQAKRDSELRVESLERTKALLSDVLSLGQDQIQLEADLAAAQVKTATALSDLESKRQAQINLLEAEVKLAIKAGELESSILDTLRSEGTALSDNTKLREALSDQANEILNNAEELYQIGVAQNKVGDKQKRLLGDIAGSIGFVRMESNSFLGNLIGVGNQLRESDAASAAFAENFKSVFNFSNAIFSVFTKIVEATTLLVVAADKAQASLARTTGTGRELADVMVDAQQATNVLGVSMQDAANATSMLQTQTTNFVNISDTAKSSLVAQVALLDRLGVTNAMAAETFQFLNLNLGMTSFEAEKSAASLAMMGTELGISAEQITKDFNQSLGLLAVYGPRSIQVFQGIASAAKAAGVETQSLLNIARRFDTFAGAAEGAAKFNALLGTQLSTTEMLMMKEDERIQMLIEQVQMQGVAFGDMDRFSQKAIAAAAGIDDLNEAQKIFGMNLGQFQEYRSQMERNTEAQEKFEQAVMATMDITNKFKVLSNEFAIAVKPILSGIHSVLDTVIEVVNSIDEDTREAVGRGVAALGTMMIAFKVIAPAIMTAVKGFTLLKGVLLGSAAVGAAGAAGAGAAGAVAGGGMIAGITALAGALAPLTPLILGLSAAAVSLSALNNIAFTADTEGLAGAAAEMEAIGANNEIMVRASATMENAALATAGRARDAKGAVITASQAVLSQNSNIGEQIATALEGLKMILMVEDGVALPAYVSKVANA